MAGVPDMDRREGRGRLSSIDMLPDDAEPDIVWALEQLRANALPANMILVEFNRRLAERGLGPISKSAWGRFSIRKAIQFRKLDEVHKISGELVRSLGTEGPDQLTVALAEMIKLNAYELIEGGGVSSKTLLDTSRALASAVSAQKGSAEDKRQRDAEIERRMAQAAASLNEAGSKAGLTADALQKITQLLTTGTV